MKKKYYDNISQIEEFDEFNRKKRSEYRILQTGGLLLGTQLFEYDDAGNITKRTVTHIQDGMRETKECSFFYDAFGKVVSYKELLYQKEANPIIIHYSKYRYVIVSENHSAIKKHIEYLVYSRNALQEKGKENASEEKLAFKVVLEISKNGCKQLYYLPNDVLSFQRDSFQKGDYASYLSPVGGKWLWSLADIDNASATINLYETILTFEIYREIVDYCKSIYPQLDFISFAPECFIEPVEEVDRITNWCQETGVWYGVY